MTSNYFFAALLIVVGLAFFLDKILDAIVFICCLDTWLALQRIKLTNRIRLHRLRRRLDRLR